MTQAQAGMQECLVVFARSVEVLQHPPKTRPIEVRECDLNIVPSWRSILARDHGHEPFKDGFMREHFGWFKIHDLHKTSTLIRSAISHQWHMLRSSVTEEYDHAGSSECYPDAAQTDALEQGQADRRQAAAATKTRLVNPDEAPD